MRPTIIRLATRVAGCALFANCWRDVAAAASPPLTSAGLADRSTAVVAPVGRP